MLTHSDRFLSVEDFPSFSKDENRKVQIFASNFRKKYKALHRPRSLEEFKRKHPGMLETNFLEDYAKNVSNSAGATGDKADLGTPGRPKLKLPFNELSDRTKRRRTATLRETVPTDELTFAAKTSIYNGGKRLAAEMIEHTLSSPSKPKKMKEALKAEPVVPYSDDEALAWMLDTKVNRDNYQLTRSQAKKRKADIYPSYKKIQEAKKRCYPGDIFVDDFKATVPLQSLLDHTAHRILQVQEEVLSEQLPGPKSLVLVSKWGFDSATGQHLYHQKTNQPDENVDENSLFVTNVVPLRVFQQNDPSKVIWKNPTPSSTRYCRQLSFEYKKETTTTNKEKRAQVEKKLKISNLIKKIILQEE